MRVVIKDKKSRSSNLELLRIIAILLIILTHAYQHTEWSNELSILNYTLLHVLGDWARLGINCFILITGYFGINTYEIRIDKIVKLIRERWLYSVFISLFFFLTGLKGLNIKNIIVSLFPILTCRHNYITSFVLLYILMPFVNSFLHSLSQQKYKMYLLIVIIFCSFFPTFIPGFDFNSFSYLGWMIVVYSIGAYIGKFDISLDRYKHIRSFLLFSTVFILTFSFNINFDVYGFYNESYNIVMLMLSIFVFDFFNHLEISNSEFINFLSSSTFGVYMIHDDPFIREVLWTKVVCIYKYEDSCLLFFYLIICVFILYIACVILDKIFKIMILDNTKNCDEKILRVYNTFLKQSRS